MSVQQKLKLSQNIILKHKLGKWNLSKGQNSGPVMAKNLILSIGKIQSMYGPIYSMDWRLNSTFHLLKIEEDMDFASIM